MLAWMLGAAAVAALWTATMLLVAVLFDHAQLETRGPGATDRRRRSPAATGSGCECAPYPTWRNRCICTVTPSPVQTA